MGGKHATTTSRVSIPKEVLARYNAVNARAQTAADTPFRAFGNTASDYVAQMNAQQNAGINDINATAGSYQPYMTQATAATQAGMGPAYEGIDNYMSPYIKNVADTTGAYMRQQQEQAQSGALGTAAMSGAFGGDRAGIAAANLQQQNQMGYGKTMADIMNQGYTQALGASQQDLARQLQGGAQMAQLGSQSQQLGLQGAQAKIAAGTMQQQTEQAGKDAMIQRFMQEQGYPFQTAQFLANIAMGTGAAQGSTTTTQTPVGIFGNLATGGRVGGYADGGGVAGPRTYSQGQIGGEGYVPVGDLPIGQLMIAPPPEQSQKDSSGDILKLITSAMGAAHGGAIDQRHGYATDGYVLGPNTEELRHWLASRDEVSGLGLADRARSQANTAAAMASKYDNPANSMAPPVVMPNAIPANAPMVNKPTGDIEAWDQPPVRGGQTEARAIPVRGGPTGLDTPVRSGPTGLDTPVRSGPTGFDTPIRSGATPMVPVGGVGGPGTFAAGAMPSELALHRPQPRPADLGVPAARYDFPTGLGVAAPAVAPADGVGGADVAADALRTIKVDPMLINGGKSVPAAPAVMATGPQTDTGVVPQGGYNPIVPLKTELAFVTHELQQPQYRGYLEQKYATPEQAAVQFESIYEKSGGAGNDVAAANARNIFDAARNGNLDSLPPNVAEAYNHFVQNGMDPVQAAGATGRLMVESYARLDPNARNTLGGGNGTFGIAQWRGSRMEDLAKFAGVPLDALTGAPVSTPEGRYYSTGAKTDGGLGGADMAAGQQAPAGGVKPYEDRNFLGKFFHNQDGSMNPIAFKSILGGLGAMARTNTISPISALLQGIAGGEDVYNKLQNEEPKRVADILANNANARIQYQTDLALGYPGSFDQWAKSKFQNGAQSMTGGPNGNVAPISQITGGKSVMGVPLDPTGSGFAMPIQLPDGSGTILASQSYAYNSQLADSVARDAALGIPFAQNTLKIAQANIAAIEANKGKVQTTDGRIVDDPTYTSRMFGANSAASDLVASDKLQQALPAMTQDAQNYKRRTDQLATALSTMPTTGPLAGWASTAGSYLTELGLMPESDAATGYQTAYKTLADEALTTMAGLAGTVDTSTLAGQIQRSNPTPENTPRAIEHVLAIRAAVSDYQLAMNDYLNKAMADPNNAGINLEKLRREFAANNDIADFVAQEDQKYTGMIEPIMPKGFPSAVWNDDTVTKDERRTMAQEWNAAHGGNTNGQP